MKKFRLFYCFKFKSNLDICQHQFLKILHLDIWLKEFQNEEPQNDMVLNLIRTFLKYLPHHVAKKSQTNNVEEPAERISSSN